MALSGRPLGIQMEMESVEFKVLAKKRHDGTFQIARNGYWPTTTMPPPPWRWCVSDSDQNTNHHCKP